MAGSTVASSAERAPGPAAGAAGPRIPNGQSQNGSSAILCGEHQGNARRRMPADGTRPAGRRRLAERQVSITFGQMLTRARPIDVLFVILPHSLLLDIAGAAEAFRLADQHRGRLGLPPRFTLRFAAPHGQQPTSVGLTIADLEPLPGALDAPTWVVVVGQPSEHLGV